MELKIAGQFACCCNCEIEGTQEAIFTCIKSGCSKFGEPYCEGCGQSAHKRKNHQFNINSDHIKSVDVNTIQKNIKQGISMVNTTLAVHDEKIAGDRRNTVRALASSIISTVFPVISEAGSIVSSGGFGAASGIGALYMAALEVTTHTARFMRGEITSWKEYGYHIGKGLSSAGGMFLGNWGGAAGGAALGTLIGGPIGTVIGGIIGAIAGGVIGAKVGRKVFEAIFPDDFIQNKQNGREHMIRDSLKLFGFSSVKDIENPEIFNEKELRKTYHTLAKRYHPDKNGGSPESYAQFHEINAALGVLLSLLQKDNKTKVVQTLTEIRAIKWKRDIKQLSKILKQQKLLYVVDVCCKWNETLSIEFLSGMKKQDILEVINDLNDDQTYNGRISVIDKNRFANSVEKWNIDNESTMSNDEQKEDIEQDDNAPESNSDEDDVDDIEYDEMEELKDQLRTKKVLFIADICKKLDEDCTLEELMTSRESDILELIDEINKDESNGYNIPVMKKKKFARIICQFAAK